MARFHTTVVLMEASLPILPVGAPQVKPEFLPCSLKRKRGLGKRVELTPLRHRATPSPLNGERAGVRGVTDPDVPTALRALFSIGRCEGRGLTLRFLSAALLTPALSSIEEERERDSGAAWDCAVGRAPVPRAFDG